MAAAILATAPLYAVMAQVLTTDMLLSALTTIAIFSLFLHYQEGGSLVLDRIRRDGAGDADQGTGRNRIAGIDDAGFPVVGARAARFDSPLPRDRGRGC